MLDQITSDDFKPFTRESFFIRFENEMNCPAILKSVVEWGSGSERFRQPFTLEFETELKEKYYLQGTYTLIHPKLGELDIFMVPIGPSNTGMVYEVVFS